MTPHLAALILANSLSCAVALAATCIDLHWQEPDPQDPRVASVVAPPSPRDARALGVGRHVMDAVGLGLDGVERSWRSGRGEILTVVALTSVTCPLSRKFAPSLARIESAYAGKGVSFVYVNVSGTDGPDEMRAQTEAHGFRGLYLADKEQRLVQTLNARTTTEVFVIDAGNTLVYRGAVSDQHGIGFSHDEPRNRYLEQALDAALRRQQPVVPATNAPGCAIEVVPSTQDRGSPPAVTYARDISRILQDNCIECHRDGGVAPFALDDYEAVSRRASMIRTVTQVGLMPPWFAAEPPVAAGAPASAHGSPWANDRSLGQREKDAIAAWIDAGKPRGDEADLPLRREFAADEWSIGTPDAVYQLPEPIAIKADGFMPYQNVLVPTHLTGDKWVRGAQIVPTDKSVVHHVLVFVLPEAALQDRAARRRAAIDEARGFFAAYVPGNDAVLYPDGMARRLPKGSVLAFQIHYTPSGTATHDQLKIGFLFTDGAPRHLVRTAAVANRRIRIPPGARHHEESATVRLPADAKILAFMPHMHLRGKAFRYEIERPGAGGTDRRQVVLDIPRYDFNWQLRYRLREPIDAPRGTSVRATAWYDNSADNPANPDPGKTVRWGPQTYDEMMLGYFDYYLEKEDPSLPDPVSGGAASGGVRGLGAGRLSFDQLLRQFDDNDDERIERSEVPENLHRQFDRLDRTKDGVLTRADFED
jgi:thiol-disulfide isomerase/thioredoxin